MRKKSFYIVLTLFALFALTLSLAACSSTTDNPVDDEVTATAGADTTQDTQTTQTVLKVGASPSPHAEILASVKEALAAEGIDLQIEEFTDYVLPNKALEDGDLDANYFQHEPYLLDFNDKNGTNLVTAAFIHAEPMGIYAGKSSDLNNIPDGAEIAVPSDATNEARALQLLAAQGILTLKEGVGLEATKLDILENPYNVEILETEAAAIPRTLPDVDFAVINGNYALDGGVIDKILVTESADAEGAQKFANVIAVRQGDEDRPEIQALIKALTSEATRQFITENYGANVLPAF